MSQLERVFFIDRALRSQGPLTVSRVVEQFEVSERQVKRDIEYMRDRLRAPIEYDNKSRSYRYVGPFETLKFADERMLLFYVMVRSIAASKSYLPFVSKETLAHIEQSMGKGYLQASEAIRYQLPVEEELPLDHLAVLCRCLVDGLQAELSYCNAQGHCSERLVEVQVLENYNGRWYLVAYDWSKESLRTFQLQRIDAIRQSSHPVAWLKTNETERRSLVDQHLSSGFGVFHGSQTQEVSIEFSQALAPVVSNQRWHPQQRDAEEAGRLIRSFPVAQFNEVLGRILSFGSQAKPLSPPALVELWKDEVRAMAAMDPPPRS